MPRPAGSPNKDKPFVEALRMELAAAGDNHKALRRIAKTLIGMAENGDMQAISAIADRLDGKPAQTVDMNVRKIARELTDDELASIAAGSGDGTAQASVDPRVTH